MAERYELRRSRRKTLALEVTREGQVIVRAPLRMSEKQIERFVAAHADWIVRAQEHQRERLHIPNRMKNAARNSSAAQRLSCRPRWRTMRG